MPRQLHTVLSRTDITNQSQHYFPWKLDQAQSLSACLVPFNQKKKWGPWEQDLAMFTGQEQACPDLQLELPSTQGGCGTALPGLEFLTGEKNS